ncbi:hypothetical protein BKA67DRAFT_598940 [Truncatella angustata]|uniref:U6 small nuclear RNA (adenine-(43)-N(6))-methyltransferase n=1 Tax=Truncatella angustata TaxID=152316 RepID=A0A9P9A2Q3_9PEZI|nr:uncharacterized protein BKA67DRAFT_598940 [Truncatella angustata]KAH6660961.1 hypothetical protein BKA67DRAFT_598940 [Truncatella angustata]KAH8193535.1 hypothetical protein TruAng_012299 [Truncatella angustata]
MGGGEISNEPNHVRGVKRKHVGDEVRLTFSQRLAAAQKNPKQIEGGSASVRAEVNSSPKFPDSSDVEDSPKDTQHLEKDDHYRHLYTNEVDFVVLAENDEKFRACLKDGRHLDFTDPLSVMQLTKSLLKVDFDLHIELPQDRLCPPVQNRHNYLLWIKELLDSSASTYSDTYEPDRKVVGLDIGTGASSIYPLLGCAQRPAWSFIATDIDTKSLSYARNNVEVNRLSSRIRIVQRSVDGSIVPLDDLEIESIDFTMTNPPFYASEAELTQLAKLKSKPPNSACTGAPNEMVCDGGEVGFFKRIFSESLILRKRVQWYTTMLGKQSSLQAVVQVFQEHEIENYAMTELIQGSKTRRWAVGWSFMSRRPNNKACRGFEPSAGKKFLPYLTEMVVASRSVHIDSAKQLENVFWTQLEDVTDGLDLVSWNLDEDKLRVVGFADENVWSRAYRRSKARQSTADEAQEKHGATKLISECAFGFSITVKARHDQKAAVSNVDVVVRWLQGTDYSLFESFYGMLRNALLNVI